MRLTSFHPNSFFERFSSAELGVCADQTLASVWNFSDLFGMNLQTCVPDSKKEKRKEKNVFSEFLTKNCKVIICPNLAEFLINLILTKMFRD